MSRAPYPSNPKRYQDNIDWSANLKVASGTIVATASDTKTAIKLSSPISMESDATALPGSKYLVKVETDINDTSGNAILYTYNRDAIDGTNVRDVLLDTFTITNVSATSSYGCKVQEGLFLGSEGTIKLGIAYAADTSSELTAAYSIYRL